MSNQKYARILVNENGSEVGTIVRVIDIEPDGGIMYHELEDINSYYEYGASYGYYEFVNTEDAGGSPVPVSDEVSHPSHYQHPSGIEVIEITKHESFLRGNIIKYVLRAPSKGTELLDLKKARQYLDWEIERVEGIKSNA